MLDTRLNDSGQSEMALGFKAPQTWSRGPSAARLQLNSAQQRTANNVSSSTNTDEPAKRPPLRLPLSAALSEGGGDICLRAGGTFVFLNLYGLPRLDGEAQLSGKTRGGNGRRGEDVWDRQ